MQTPPPETVAANLREGRGIDLPEGADWLLLEASPNVWRN